MSLTNNDDFRRDTIVLIGCQSPLVLDVTLQNTNISASSGDVYVSIAGVSPNAENTTTYNFDLGYVETTGSGPNYDHKFKLDITDIIRKVCNDPDLRNETAGGYKMLSRLATYIGCFVKSSGEITTGFYNYYAHGFNQVNNPDSSCLVDFGDPAVEAIIPIVPGAPMLWHVWNNALVAGAFYLRLFDSAANQISTITLANPVTQGLVQGTGATFNQNLYDDWSVLEEYILGITPNIEPNSISKVTCVALKKVCEGDVVLAWLNRFGVYSYMAFERFPTHRGQQKHIGSFDLEVYDIADLQSRTKSRGYTGVQKVISAVVKSVPIEYFEAIEDLFYSMDVYYFTGTLPEYEFDPAEWLRVQVRGTLVERKKQSFENVRVDILLPEKYTQIR
jgi:hypothetical protein